METKLYSTIDILEIVEQIKADNLIAFPTDTVFGLAGNLTLAALNNLKKAKGRPADKPFPIMVSNIEMIKTIAMVNQQEEAVIRTLMPGALTIILNKKKDLADIFTNNQDSVAIRMPNDKFILELINRINNPIMVSSANVSGNSNTTNTEEVLEQLKGKISGVVAGVSGGSLPSTIVDCRDGIKILRNGEITLANIKEVLNER
ncbi:MAG: L-threonylcarbamoyladenylate synthase [Erysipelotrichaceae bacterium]